MVVAASDVTKEIREAATEIVHAWYGESGRIDWDDVWDRLDGFTLADDTVLDLGSDLNSPALRAIKRYVYKERPGW